MPEQRDGAGCGYTAQEWRDLIARVPLFPKEWQQVPSGQETRVTSETGGQKGSKPSQLATAPPAGLTALGEVCGMGAEKYEPHNYRRGYPWSLSVNALYRHLLAFVSGETYDPESKLPHMAHAAWHALVLIQFMQDHPEYDDRYVAD